MKSCKKGYTLVELVVVMLILSILLAVAGFSLYSYTRYAKFKNYNEDAQTIYVAAQEALTHYKASGQLEDYASKVKKNAIKTAHAKNYNNIKPEIKSEYKERLYTIFYSSKYIEDELGYNDESHKLFVQLMERYLSNHDVMNGSVAIEFDPSDGVVYSVSYSLQADHFYYGDDFLNDNDEKVVDITNRDVSVRKKRMFGYYDVNNLTAAAPSDPQKPVINNLELVNDEALYLKWCMDDIYNEVAESFDYNIELYNGAENYTNNTQPLMKFKINSTNDLIPDKEAVLPEVSCQIVKGNTTEDYKLRAYKTIEDDKTYFYVVLDAVDLSSVEYIESLTGSYKTYAINNQNLKNTYSIERFELGCESIYARVRASSRFFKSSVWKQSNTEDILFDQREKENEIQELTDSILSTTTANISNNRHLYNIRFIEDKETSIDLSKKNIYKQTGMINYRKAQIFRTIGLDNDRKVINYNSKDLPSFPSLGELNLENRFINSNNFKISNLKLGDEENKNAVGLFKVNKGIIDGIELENVTALGKDDVGTISAYNSGTINNVKVTGQVSGNKNVGGISATVVKTTENVIKINNSINKAKIVGNENVGGIIGATDQRSSINSCDNTGRIIGVEQDGKVPIKLGGITGYNSEGCEIKKSTSSSKWNDEDALNIISKAQYVGGIAGVNNGSINDCSTGISNQSTYVVGDKYVGGIVGIQEGNGSLTNSKLESNKCIVVGNENVGGIIGANTKRISNWMNEGVVICRKNNGGGIAGYNESEIFNCKAMVRYNALTIKYDDVKQYSIGSNVGGVVGFNSSQGIVDSSEEQENIVVSSGYDNVGGMIGLNEGTMLNQKITGGYINGNDSVGGAIGLNRSLNTLKDQIIKVNVNQIEGHDNVAGVIGYNQLILNKDIDLQVSFVTDSFAGYVSGNKNVGGFIGLNDVFCRRLTIGDDTVYTNDMNYIKGNIYVGGIIGKDVSCDQQDRDHTMVVIRNIDNKTRVISTDYVREYDSDLKKYVNYSYSAGITGRNSRHMTINNCSNQKQITVNEAVHYLGGLVEVNEGAVIDCTTYSLGSYTRNNVGGLVGKNASGANIDDCLLSGIITGNNNIGGFVVDNYGQITRLRSSINATVNASGMNIGGIVACNYKTVKTANTSITINGNGTNVGGLIGLNAGDISDVDMLSSQNITGNSYVGGVIGKHIGGNLKDLCNINNVMAKIGDAGGIVGIIDVDKPIEVINCVNDGEVVAIMNNAGGITSEISNSVKIKKATNSGSIKATLAHAGGIVAVNNGSIELSTVENSNHKVEITGRGYVGGIATENYGVINECQIGNIDLSVYGAVFKGTNDNIYIGGVSAINKQGAQIINTVSIDNSKLIIEDGFENSYFGGVTGLNEGRIEGNENTVILADIGTSDNNFDAYYGGIAGYNKNIISGYTFSGKITGKGGAGFGYGGIVGVNESKVIGCKIVNTNILTSSDEANTGGIVGYNKSAGQIDTCFITGKTTVRGPQLNNGQSFIGNVGGIAGMNEGLVEKCIHANLNDQVSVSTKKGNLGGIVGLNTGAGKVNDCSTAASWDPIQSDLAGTDLATGGVIGYSSSSADSYVNLVNYTEVIKKAGNSVGGILGRLENSTSLWTISKCENYGSITGASGGEGGRIGGIIGQVKYKGGNIVDCINSGEIICNDGSTGLGGIVGFIYILNANETMSISNCTNFGNILKTQKSAGILGEARTTAFTKNNVINISDCVNTGEIPKKNSAGIVILGGNNGFYNITNCINYYNFKHEDSAGIVLANGRVDKLNEFSNNIDAGVSKHPGINFDSIKNENNYYFSEDDSQGILPIVNKDKSTVRVNNNDIEGEVSSNNNQTKDKKVLYDDSTKQRFTVDMSKYGGLSGEKFNNELVFTTKINSIEETVLSLQTYWYNGNDNYGEIGGTKRRMDYKIVIHTLTGDITYPKTGTYFKDLDGDRAYFTNAIFEPITGVTSIDLIVVGGTSRYVSIYEIKVNERDNIVKDGNDETFATSKLIVEKDNDTYRGVNVTRDVAITNMKINPTLVNKPDDVLETLAKYKYDNLNDAIKGYTSGDTRDFSQYRPVLDNDIIDVGGKYKVSWQFNDYNGNKLNASRYLLEIKDNRGKIIYSKIVYGNMYDYIPVNSSWGKVDLCITALSNRANSKTSKDKSITMKEPLKTPSFNFVANKNNTFDIIINNLEDYNQGDIIIFEAKGNEVNYIVGSDTNKNINSFGYDSFATAQAKPGKNSAKYGNSVMYSAQTSALLIDGFSKDMIKFVDFKGISANTLRYEIKFKTGIQVQDYYRQDLLLPDEAIQGLPVAVSSSVYRVNQYATNMITELTSIPENIANENTVRVQSYVWASQNNVTNYYVYLYKNLAAKQLNDHIDEFTINGKLKDGYVIEKNSDDTYSVYYSLSLEMGIQEMSISDDKDKRYVVRDLDVPEAMTKPQIDSEAPQLKDGKYTFRWKVKDDLIGKDSYNITLYGVDKSGGKVELVNENINALSYTTKDARQWNYKQLRVVVTHIGKENDNGYTDKLSSSSTVSYEYKLKLSQVTSPLVSIINDKHSYTYNISFNKLIDDEEKEAVDHYEVHAQAKVNDKVYKIVKNTTLDNCSIELEFVDHNGRVVDVPEGTEIEFYVNAIAKIDSELFTDSLDGDVSVIDLPHRIAKPDCLNVTIDEGPISVDKINSNGILITKTSNSTTDLDANYEIKYLLEGYNEKYSDPKTMDGTINEGTINLKNLINENLADYAGRKIKIKLRAVSSQAVSSKWSDEIDLVLPKGKVDFVVEDIQILQNREDLILYEDGTESNIRYGLERKSIILPAHKYSSGYDLMINYQQVTTLEDKYRFYHSLKVDNKEVKRITMDHLIINDNGLYVNLDGTVNYDRFNVMYDVYSLQVDKNNQYVMDSDGNYVISTTPTKLDEYEIRIDEIGNQVIYTYSLSYLAKTYQGITPTGIVQTLTVIPKLYIYADLQGNVISYQFTLLDSIGHNDAILGIQSDKAITANIRFTALVNDNEHYEESQVLEYYREQFENTAVEGIRVYDPSKSIKNYMEKMLNVSK